MHLAARAALAAVLLALMIELSSIVSTRPSVILFITRMAEALSLFKYIFSGKEDIHFKPASS